MWSFPTFYPVPKSRLTALVEYEYPIVEMAREIGCL